MKFVEQHMNGHILLDGHAAEISSCDLQRYKAGRFVMYLGHCMTCLSLHATKHVKHHRSCTAIDMRSPLMLLAFIIN
jgi:hypothetical protein